MTNRKKKQPKYTLKSFCFGFFVGEGETSNFLPQKGFYEFLTYYEDKDGNRFTFVNSKEKEKAAAWNKVKYLKGKILVGDNIETAVLYEEERPSSSGNIIAEEKQ